MLASPFEAEDAVQETLLRAWKAYDKFEGRAAMRTWLHRIATNVCLDMLDMSVASINSALQRARARLRTGDLDEGRAPIVDEKKRDMLKRYVEAFERYDVNLLTKVIREDARQSMPPFDLWLQGRDDMFRWWFGAGIGCKGSRVIAAGTANGSPAFGQYKPSANGGYEPWALQVVELTPSGIGEITFFLDTAKLFPLFGLPPRLGA